jgi:UDP-N-acetylmuramyl pentapeptide synthase
MGALYAKLPPHRRGFHVNTAAEITEIYRDFLKPGDCILVKASLGTGLGAVVKAILQLGQSQGMSLEKEI